MAADEFALRRFLSAPQERRKIGVFGHGFTAPRPEVGVILRDAGVPVTGRVLNGFAQRAKDPCGRSGFSPVFETTPRPAWGERVFVAGKAELP